MNEKEARRIVDALGYKNNLSDQEMFMFTDAMSFLIKKEHNPEDMMLLGGVYYEQRNFDLALKYYEMASEQDYEPADECLGYIWYYGRTGNRDYEKAFYHFSKSAKLGNLVSQYKIADMYKNGYFVEKDYDKYVSIIKELYPKVKNAKYTNQPLPEVFTRLARIYVKEGDTKRAIRLYDKAKDFLIQRIMHNAFWGNLNIMMWLIDDLYKLKNFNKKNFDLYDMFYLLTKPCIITFKCDDTKYTVHAVQENDIIAIEFNDKWFRKREEFFAKATIDDMLLTSLYYDLYSFEVIDENSDKS